MIGTWVLVGFIATAGAAIAAACLVYTNRIAVKIVGSL